MRLRSTLLAAAVLVAVAAAAPAEAPAAVAVEQMVVFRSGKAVTKKVSTAGVKVRVGRRRCAVASNTPLAGLWRSRPARIRLRDFGGCSRSTRDAGQVYVHSIGRDAERGLGGWVYKVGRREASAGAGDRSGPFGRGRLRRGQRVLWFLCREAGNCQRTLELRTSVEQGAVVFTATGYDSSGRGARVPGATVRAGAATLTTGADGTVRAVLPPGRHAAYASKRGLVRSFAERVTVG